MLVYLLANKTSTDFIHDPFGQFIISVTITLIFGIVPIVLTIWMYRKQRNRKKLSYQVEIKYDGKRTRRNRLLVLKIWNSGNIAIKPEDYFETVKFDFEGGEVTDCQVLGTGSKNPIDPNEIKTGQDCIELPAFPLNPKDSIELEVSFTGRYLDCSYRGRIADGTIVEAKTYNEPLSSIRRTRILEVPPVVVTLLLIGGIIWVLLLTNIIAFGSGDYSSSNRSGCHYAMYILGFQLCIL